MKLLPFNKIRSRRIGIEIGVIILIFLSLCFNTLTENREHGFFPLKELHIRNLNNLNYDSVNNRFVALGDDPWFEVIEENRYIPILDVAAEFRDTVNVGAFPIYYIPFDRQSQGYREKWKVLPDVEKNQNGIRLHWVFPRKVARFRIDPFPSSEFTLNGIEASYGSEAPEWLNIVWFIFILYGVIRIAWFCEVGKRNSSKHRRVFYMGVILFTVTKLWLVQGQNLAAYFGAGHDDHLFLRLAQNILGGSWLGGYNELTLIKGPMYPIWIAVSFLMGIPLLLGQHLLYAGACILLIWLLSKHDISPTILLVFFLLLIFNPVTYDFFQARVIRAGLYVPLTLWIFVFLFSLYHYRLGSIRRLIILGTGLGLFLAAFWLTREEGVWLLPSIILLIGYTIYDLRLMHTTEFWKRFFAVCMVPVVIWGGGLLVISTINYIKYGIFCSVEFKHESFKQAYGALSRVSPDRHLPHIPVPRDTRHEIYEVSPHFKELKPFLEGETGEKWASYGALLTGFDPKEREISGGAFMWAFREAAAKAGFHTDGKSAMTFYSQMAQEINAACEKGRLHCTSERSSMRPPFRQEYAKSISQRFVKEFFDTASFRHIRVFQMYSWLPAGYEADRPFAEFEDLTLEDPAPQQNGPVYFPYQERINHFKMNILDSIFFVYKTIMPIVFIGAVFIFIISTIYRLLQKDLSFLFVFNVSLLGAVFARFFILLYIDVTSFPAVNSQYLSPAYPLILLFCIVSFVDGYTILHSFQRIDSDRT